MFPQYSNLPRRLIAAVVAIASFSPASVSGSEKPRPTPRPGTLGAYAREITIDRSAFGDPDGRVILTNENVVGFGTGATITLGAVMTAVHGRSKASSGGSSADRSRVRAAHRKQQQVIADLERQRSLLEVEIRHIDNQSLTPKILARLDRAKSKRRHLDQEISRARDELARIVRDARRQGAEPGWFR
jgi:hypothetical protein